MTIPAYARTWHQYLTTGTPGVRATFVSLTDASQQAMYQFKNYICNLSGATTKWSVLWTCSAGTGPTSSADTTDRWTSASTVTPQGASAGVSQAFAVLVGAPRPSWQANTNYTLGQYVTNSGNVYVCRQSGTSASSGGPTGTTSNITDNGAAWQFLQAGNGAPQMLVAYQGATADVFRVSFSPGGLFTLAGTTNQQPTATDEQVLCSATSMVGSTASGDRILHFWASDDGAAVRGVVLRAGAMAGLFFGVETIADGVQQFPVVGSASVATLPCNSWGFAFSSASLAAGSLVGTYLANTRGGLMRSLVSGTAFSNQVVLASEFPGASAPESIYSFQAELQGASGYPVYPFAAHSTNAVGARGRLGNLIDWYTCAPSGFALGDGAGSSYQWWQLNALLVPNPSAVAPTLT